MNYTHYFSIIFLLFPKKNSIIFTIIFLIPIIFPIIFLLCKKQYIIFIIFAIIFNYFKGSAPSWWELAYANPQPSYGGLTDKLTAGQAVHLDQQESANYQQKGPSRAVLTLLFSLFLLLFSLLSISEQE